MHGPWIQAYTGGITMELGMHAQLIPTHRQFKVQYSTYATQCTTSEIH